MQTYASYVGLTLAANVFCLELRRWPLKSCGTCEKHGPELRPLACIEADARRGQQRPRSYFILNNAVKNDRFRPIIQM